MSNNDKALKSGIWYTAANFITRSIGFITTPIFARLLTKAEFGAYNNYTSWLAILTIILTLNLYSTFISARFDFKGRFDEYILSMLLLSSSLVLIALVVFSCFRDFFVGLLRLDSVYIYCMLAYLLFSPAIHMYQTRERYYFEYKKTVFISLLLSISTAVVSVLLVKNLENRLLGRILGGASVTIAIGAVLFVVLSVRGKKINIAYWKYALPICLPFIPHLLSMTMLNSMDRIMITSICGEEQNAYYSLAYSCGAIISMLTTSMNTAFAPWLGEKLHNDSIEEIRSFSKIYISAFLYMAVGIMLVTPEILMIMGGISYMEAMYIMPPITCGVACQFLYTLFVNVEQFKKKTVGMAVASVSAALLNYLLNAIFIPKYGYVAAAYTTLASFLWLLSVHMILVKKIGYANAYDYRFVIISVVILVIITVGVNYIYYVDIIRYCVVACYVCISILAFLKYKNIILNKIGLFKSN